MESRRRRVLPKKRKAEKGWELGHTAKQMLEEFNRQNIISLEPNNIEINVDSVPVKIEPESDSELEQSKESDYLMGNGKGEGEVIKRVVIKEEILSSDDDVEVVQKPPDKIGLPGIIKLACIWKYRGCAEMATRQKLKDHETICKYGLMNICSAHEWLAHCNFKFDTFQLSQTGKWRHIFNHFETQHNFSVKRNLRWGHLWDIELDISRLQGTLKMPKSISSFYPKFFVLVNGDNSPCDVFVLFVKLKEDDDKQKMLSFAFGMLTSEKVQTERSKFSVKVWMKGQTKPEMQEKWGEDCIPDISWTMKPMDTVQLKRFLKASTEKGPSFPYSIPFSHIQNYYVDGNGKLTVRLSFEK